MCGIAGLINSTERQRCDFPEMLAAISHRGPDANGVWTQDSAGLVLGHARLAVIDVSAAGAQPMTSVSGRYVLTYNGEIYNHKNLRTQLQNDFGAVAWRGESDTEALLAMIENMGIAATLDLIQGMFAFAVWDRDEEILTIARDRMGEKPLYYGVLDGVAVFCSELHAIRSNSAMALAIDRNAVSAFGQYGFVPGPISIYESIAKLPPGCYGSYSMRNKEWCISQYWSTAQVAAESVQERQHGSEEQMLQQLESTLLRVVEQEMLSDVPFGAFLSGGIDSSLVVSMMQKISTSPISTFTIGFNEKAYNEAERAKQVASHLRTHHTELYLEQSDLLSIVPAMGALYDEPFSDESAIPTHLVSKLARGSVTVALSGDGGDELFSGYNRHRFAASSWPKIKNLPPWLKGATALALSKASPFLVGHINKVQTIFGARIASGDVVAKLRKLSLAATAGNLDELYNKLLVGGTDGRIWQSDDDHCCLPLIERVEAFNDVEQMMLYDLLFYLPDDILVKVDRAAMGCSLETRAPLLHPDIVSLAWRLPYDMKFRKGVSKWALREVLYRSVPSSLVSGPKVGFEVPIAQWMRGPLREWIESLCSKSSLEAHGLLSTEATTRMMDDHYNRGVDRTRELWRVVCFQSWYQAQHNTVVG